MVGQEIKELEFLFFLVQLTGLSIRSHVASMCALTTNWDMPDFKVMKVAVRMKTQVCEQFMFIVNIVIEYSHGTTEITRH